MDVQARRNRRETLRCEECPQRIAWITLESAVHESTRAWRWQGKRVPIRYRIDGDGYGPVVDLECFSCGWQATRSIWEVPLAALALWPRELLALEIRIAEADLAFKSRIAERRRAEAS